LNDPSLLGQQPIHGLIEFILGDGIEMKQFTESCRTPSEASFLIAGARKAVIQSILGAVLLRVSG